MLFPISDVDADILLIMVIFTVYIFNPALLTIVAERDPVHFLYF